MYSEKLRHVFKKSKVGVGERVLIEKGEKSYEGILMPRPESGDRDTIIIKLDNGYNIGIKYEDGLVIKKLKGVKKGKIKLKPVKPKKYLPSVAMVMTGGTISSRIDYRTGAVYALTRPEELLASVPELADIAHIAISNPLTKMSEDMEPEDWQKIAIAVGKKLNSSASGVIITHGTDTMHFTSAALSFMLKNLNKPVVLVGAQRSSDRGSSDAAMNVICATHIAVSDIAEVGVCMHASSNDDWCYFIRGTKVRKMHTSRRDAFRPINDRPIAKINQDGRLEILSSYRKRNDNKVEVDTRFEKRTALIKVYPGADPDIVEFMVNKGYRGFVIEATGLGHVPTFSKRSWIPYIKRYARDGIPFVIAPQTLYGRINMNVYTSGRILLEAGAIPGFDMLPEVAYVKLGWVLAHTSDIEEVRRLMTTNLAGEIAERSVHDTFLF